MNNLEYLGKIVNVKMDRKLGRIIDLLKEIKNKEA